MDERIECRVRVFFHVLFIVNAIEVIIIILFVDCGGLKEDAVRNACASAREDTRFCDCTCSRRVFEDGAICGVCGRFV